MVGAAAGPHGLLLELAQPRRGLARVEDARAGALHRLDEAGGERGHAGQPAEEVERHPLAGEDSGGRAGQLGQRPRLAPGALGRQRGEGDRGVEPREHRLGHRQARRHAGGPLLDGRSRRGAGRDHGGGGQISRSEVLLEGDGDQVRHAPRRLWEPARNADEDPMEEESRSAYGFLKAMFARQPDPYAGADLPPARNALHGLLALSAVLCLAFLPLEPVDGPARRHGLGRGRPGAGRLDPGHRGDRPAQGRLGLPARGLLRRRGRPGGAQPPVRGVHQRLQRALRDLGRSVGGASAAAQPPGGARRGRWPSGSLTSWTAAAARWPAGWPPSRCS